MTTENVVDELFHSIDNAHEAYQKPNKKTFRYIFQCFDYETLSEC